MPTARFLFRGDFCRKRFSSTPELPGLRPYFHRETLLRCLLSPHTRHVPADSSAPPDTAAICPPAPTRQILQPPNWLVALPKPLSRHHSNRRARRSESELFLSRGKDRGLRANCFRRNGKTHLHLDPQAPPADTARARCD